MNDEAIDPLAEQEIDDDWRSKFMDLGEAEAKPVCWIVENMLPAGLTIIGAPPKANKSSVAMLLAASAVGLPCEGLPPQLRKAPRTGKALVFSYEADAGELKQMCEDGLHIKVPRDGRILVSDDPWQWRLDDEETLARLIHVLNEMHPLVVVLDTFRDMHDLEEKDSGAMVRVLRPLREWAIENDSAVIMVHHTSKVSEETTTLTAQHLRGSGAIFGKADAVIMLNKRLDGKHQISFVAKRAKEWDMTVQLGIYDCQTAGSETMHDREETVLSALRHGLTLDQIAKQMHLGKQAIVESCAKLARNGYLRKLPNGKWQPVQKEMVR